MMPKLPVPANKACGISTVFLPKNPNELCDSLKLLLQEKQDETNSDIFREEIVAINDKCLDCKCISTKQHRFLLLKC